MFRPKDRRAPLIVLALLLLLSGGGALAAIKSAGPGCVLGPDEAINTAEPGDIFTPLYEENFGRNTNGAVARVALEIEGGWSAPNFDCGGNSSGVFESREEMLAAGLTYTPADRSGLTGFEAPVLSVDAAGPSLILRNINLLNNQLIDGDGGGLRVVGAAAEPRLSGAHVTIENSAFRPNFFITDPVGAQGDGGGLALDVEGASYLRISDSLFKDQTAGGRGGAFAISVRSDSRLIIERSLIEGNRAASCGGGLITIHSGTVILRGNTFQNNGADGEVADLCVERASGSSGAATLFLFDNQFSEGGLRVDPTITIFDEQVFLPLLDR